MRRQHRAPPASPARLRGPREPALDRRREGAELWIRRQRRDVPDQQLAPFRPNGRRLAGGEVRPDGY